MTRSAAAARRFQERRQALTEPKRDQKPKPKPKPKKPA
jgi:hypothetical protein